MPRRCAGALVAGLLIAGTGGATVRSAERVPRPPATRADVVPSGRPVTTAAERAIVTLSRAVARGAGVPVLQARCVARRTVVQEGLDRLVAAGVLTADGRFGDPDLGGHAEVRRALRAAAEACRW